jgi:hypothetical protein
LLRKLVHMLLEHSSLDQLLRHNHYHILNHKQLEHSSLLQPVHNSLALEHIRIRRAC